MAVVDGRPSIWTVTPGSWYCLLTHPLEYAGEPIPAHWHSVVCAEVEFFFGDWEEVGLCQKFYTEVQARGYGQRVGGNLRAFQHLCSSCYPGSRGKFWLVP